MRIFGILVTYNTSLESSSSFQWACQQPDLEWVVVDNSTKDTDIVFVCNQHQVPLLKMNGNEGLSKAYNAGLSWISQQQAHLDDLVLLMDDDTKFPSDYLEVVRQASQDTDYELLVPYVESEKGLLSPCLKRHGLFVAGHLDNLIDKDFSAINSGLVCRLTLFKDQMFDEDLFLDFVDHHLMDRVKKENRKCHLLNTRLIQDFSGDGLVDVDSLKQRFKIFRRDAKVYYQNAWPCWWVITKRRLKLFLQTKKASFLWMR